MRREGDYLCGGKVEGRVGAVIPCMKRYPAKEHAKETDAHVPCAGTLDQKALDVAPLLILDCQRAPVLRALYLQELRYQQAYCRPGPGVHICLLLRG